MDGFKLAQLFTRLSSPSHCPLCGQKLKHNAVMCSYCIQSMPANQGPCFRCGLEIPAEEAGSANKEYRQHCGACLAKSPLQYRTVSPYLYLFPVPELIAEIKFHHRFHLVDALCEQFCRYCLAHYQEPEQENMPQLILPVPLHPKKEFRRGFNQAFLLSHRIAKCLNIPVSNTHLKRVRQTHSQMQLDIKMRKRNVRQAFALARPLPDSIEHIAIFDDVITTGATMESIALPLLKSGIKRIDFWSMARTPKSL